MCNYSEYYNECLKYDIDEDLILTYEQYCSCLSLYDLFYRDWLENGRN